MVVVVTVAVAVDVTVVACWQMELLTTLLTTTGSCKSAKLSTSWTWEDDGPLAVLSM
jgi:hypothetical protein